MIEIQAIDHIVLRTNKLSEMLEFYTGVLGCTIERQTSKEIGLTQLRAGNALIDIITLDGSLGAAGGGAPTKTERNVDHFCLQIKPTPEEVITEHLEQNNVEISEFERRYGAQGYGNSIYIKDPEGNGVELRCQL